MSSKETKDHVVISLGEEHYRTIKFDMNAVCRLEKELGHSIAQIDWNHVGFSTLRTLLWACLRHSVRNLTLEQAGDFIDQAPGETLPKRMKYVIEKVGEAFGLAFPTTKDLTPGEAEVLEEKKSLEAAKMAAGIGEPSNGSPTEISD